MKERVHETGLTADRPGFRLISQAAILFLAAAVAWLAVGIRARGMGAMPGTMGLSVGAFVGMWTLMMSAMMLPTVAPLGALYVRSFRVARTRRLTVFASGYLIAWALAALPAFGLAWVADRAIAGRGAWTTATAVVLYASCGVYQLTPLKGRCLRHCRSPIGHLMHYGSYVGRTRDLRAGVHHGAFCLGCCWGLMLVLVAVGLMNLWVMAALTGIVVLEKLAPKGEMISRALGLVALGLAVAVIWVPALAPGLQPMAM